MFSRHMTITPEQFEEILQRIVHHETRRLATKKTVQAFITSIDELALKVDSYIEKEWNVHRGFEHPNLETRIRILERKAGVKEH